MITTTEVLSITPADLEELEAIIDSELKRVAYHNQWPCRIDVKTRPLDHVIRVVERY